MEDPFGHRISYLRLSITDRCNERCHYCMPEELQTWLPRAEVLTYEEILRTVRVGASLGVRKVRVTGGEPLTRRGVLGFIRQLGAIPGIDDIGLSTNGTLLADPPPEEKGGTVSMAQRLAEAGVRTVNISLDTLDPDTYAAVTGRDFHHKVIAGIDASLAAGFQQVKLNCVLMKDRHTGAVAVASDCPNPDDDEDDDDEEDEDDDGNEEDDGDSANSLPALLDFAHERGCLLRFIELMPVTTREMLSSSNFLPTATARRIIEAATGPLIPVPGFRTNGPASYYQIPGRDQLIGFIGAMTNLHFCESCNKLRLTSDGRLRPCLGSHLEFDLRSVLRSGATDDEIRSFFRQVVDRKPKEHDFRGQWQPGRHMTAIGG
ncbi:MAG: 3,8-cyclase MoaA [Verrucomicrobiales bacterium]|nr:3,8-cyclase MoaA [Verrucomicrobiales bacterium]